MRNIERIKGMTAEQLAEFLADRGAQVPPDFCDEMCKATTDCKDCIYLGPLGDKKAWKIWLEEKHVGKENKDDQKPQEPEAVQTDEQDDPEQGSKDEKDLQQDAGRDV